MKTAVAALLLAPLTATQPDAAGSATLAYVDPRCGSSPAQPPQCLGGAWTCRCLIGDSYCSWVLLGCTPRDDGPPRAPNPPVLLPPDFPKPEDPTPRPPFRR